MPGRRGRAERRLEAALDALGAGLRSLRVPWMVIGGIAVIARGVRRFTADIDVVVRGDAVTADRVIAALAKQGIEPRIADAAAFADRNLVLLARHEPTGIDIDLSFGWTEFEHGALEERETVAIGAVRAPVARPEHLVVLKSLAGRPKDLEDAAALLVLHERIDLDAVRRQVTALAELAEEPELVEHLEAIVRAASPQRPDGSKPRAATRPGAKAKTRSNADAPGSAGRRKVTKRRT